MHSRLQWQYMISYSCLPLFLKTLRLVVPSRPPNTNGKRCRWNKNNLFVCDAISWMRVSFSFSIDTGISDRFGATFSPRLWNGRIHYTPQQPVVPTVSPAPSLSSVTISDTYGDGICCEYGSPPGSYTYLLRTKFMSKELNSHFFAVSPYPRTILVKWLLWKEVSFIHVNWIKDSSFWANGDEIVK
jgi:hypothetical protein